LSAARKGAPSARPGTDLACILHCRDTSRLAPLQRYVTRDKPPDWRTASRTPRERSPELRRVSGSSPFPGRNLPSGEECDEPPCRNRAQGPVGAGNRAKNSAGIEADNPHRSRDQKTRAMVFVRLLLLLHSALPAVVVACAVLDRHQQPPTNTVKRETGSSSCGNATDKACP